MGIIDNISSIESPSITHASDTTNKGASIYCIFSVDNLLTTISTVSKSFNGRLVSSLARAITGLYINF